jgi:uncharacterized low-complexity protein
MEAFLMSQKSTKKPLAIALGAAFVTTLAATPVANAAENPFAMSELSSGYMVAEMAEGKCGGEKTMEEGKCGGDKAGATATESADKATAEGKCGEGKCGGEKKMDKEGKCGEGKCGGEKK